MRIAAHLAYAPEIAQAMLRRQQAGAVIAAKERIVEGAMGMVEMALNRLSEQRVVELDEERKAAMVNNRPLAKIFLVIMKNLVKNSSIVY